MVEPVRTSGFENTLRALEGLRGIVYSQTDEGLMRAFDEVAVEFNSDLACYTASHLSVPRDGNGVRIYPFQRMRRRREDGTFDRCYAMGIGEGGFVDDDGRFHENLLWEHETDLEDVLREVYDFVHDGGTCEELLDSYADTLALRGDDGDEG